MSLDTATILYTSVEQASELLRERQRNTALVRRINDALGGDIPPYLLEHECFVLPRHIASPNHEALYVLEQAERFGAMAVFSQDLQDSFTSVNNLKRRLARPEVCAEIKGQLTYHKVNLVDVPKAEGLPLSEVKTRDGRKLADVHNGLFGVLEGQSFCLVNDTEWINRNHRGDIAKHYKNFLLLFLAHGVLFDELETVSDRDFKSQVVIPLFEHFRCSYGVQPLIVRPHQEPQPNERFYLSHSLAVGHF